MKPRNYLINITPVHLTQQIQLRSPSGKKRIIKSIAVELGVRPEDFTFEFVELADAQAASNCPVYEDGELLGSAP